MAAEWLSGRLPWYDIPDYVRCLIASNHSNRITRIESFNSQYLNRITRIESLAGRDVHREAAGAALPPVEDARQIPRQVLRRVHTGRSTRSDQLTHRSDRINRSDPLTHRINRSNHCQIINMIDAYTYNSAPDYAHIKQLLAQARIFHNQHVAGKKHKIFCVFFPAK